MEQLTNIQILTFKHLRLLQRSWSRTFAPSTKYTMIILTIINHSTDFFPMQEYLSPKYKKHINIVF